MSQPLETATPVEPSAADETPVTTASDGPIATQVLTADDVRMPLS